MVFRRFRKIGVWLVSGLVVTVGDVSHLLAAEVATSKPAVVDVAKPRSVRKATPRGAFEIEVLDRFGVPIQLPTDVPTPLAEPQKRLSEDALRNVRQDLLKKAFGSDSKVAALAARRLRLLDAATGKTPAERHAAILRLGVQISEAPARDGRKGTIKTFAVDGKPRVRVFIPASGRAANSDQTDRFELEAGGPSTATEETGRWKVDGSNCYWDAYDSGSDQCSPNAGRWKWGNEGGCAFDSYDSGPDQCEPAGNANGSGDVEGYTCDGGDCATPEQFDDFCSTIAEGQSEQESEEAAMSEAEGWYCTVNPGECFDQQAKPLSGPSDETVYCYAEKISAVVALAGVAGTLVTGAILVASPAVDLGLGAMVAISVTYLVNVLGFWGAWQILKYCLGYSPVDVLYDERLVF